MGQHRRKGKDYSIFFLDFLRAHIRHSRILLARHSDDLVETYWIKRFRGGRAEIPLQRNGLLLPFADIPKREILAYLHHRGIAYRLDSMNSDPHYLRVQIRKRKDLPPVEIRYGIEKQLREKIKIRLPIAEYFQSRFALSIHRHRQTGYCGSMFCPFRVALPIRWFFCLTDEETTLLFRALFQALGLPPPKKSHYQAVRSLVSQPKVHATIPFRDYSIGYGRKKLLLFLNNPFSLKPIPRTPPPFMESIPYSKKAEIQSRNRSFRLRAIVQANHISIIDRKHIFYDPQTATLYFGQEGYETFP